MSSENDRLQEIERLLATGVKRSAIAFQVTPELLSWAVEEIKRLRGAVEEEREACAQICDYEKKLAQHECEYAGTQTPGGLCLIAIAERIALCAELIRNRGKK